MADPAQNQMPPPPPPAPVQPADGQNDQQQQQLQQVQSQQQQQVAPVNQPINNVPIVQAQVVQGMDGGMAVKSNRQNFQSSGDKRTSIQSQPKNMSNGLTK
jgi:hypothetical protein